MTCSESLEAQFLAPEAVGEGGHVASFLHSGTPEGGLLFPDPASSRRLSCEEQGNGVLGSALGGHDKEPGTLLNNNCEAFRRCRPDSWALCTFSAPTLFSVTGRRGPVFVLISGRVPEVLVRGKRFGNQSLGKDAQRCFGGHLEI